MNALEGDAILRRNPTTARLKRALDEIEHRLDHARSMV